MTDSGDAAGGKARTGKLVEVLGGAVRTIINHHQVSTRVAHGRVDDRDKRAQVARSS